MSLILTLLVALQVRIIIPTLWETGDPAEDAATNIVRHLALQHERI